MALSKQGIWKSIFPDRENTGNLLKMCFYTGNLSPTQGKFWELNKILNLQFKWMELLSGCVVPGSWSVNFWLLFCKLLRGLLKWIYSGLYSSLGKERMAMGLVEAIYRLKYFIYCRQKNTGKMARTQGKHRVFGINWSVATLGTPWPG